LSASLLCIAFCWMRANCNNKNTTTNNKIINIPQPKTIIKHWKYSILVRLWNWDGLLNLVQLQADGSFKRAIMPINLMNTRKTLQPPLYSCDIEALKLKYELEKMKYMNDGNDSGRNSRSNSVKSNIPPRLLEWNNRIIPICRFVDTRSTVLYRSSLVTLWRLDSDWSGACRSSTEYLFSFVESWISKSALSPWKFRKLSSAIVRTYAISSS